jgi:hypothetical protein
MARCSSRTSSCSSSCTDKPLSSVSASCASRSACCHLSASLAVVACFGAARARSEPPATAQPLSNVLVSHRYICHMSNNCINFPVVASVCSTGAA